MEDKKTLFDVAIYLISSARDCLDEPAIYGPLRLLEGVNRVIEVSNSNPSLEDKFLNSMQKKISETVLEVMRDRNKFKDALNDLLLEFAEEMKKRTITSA